MKYAIELRWSSEDGREKIQWLYAENMAKGAELASVLIASPSVISVDICDMATCKWVVAARRPG